MTPETPSASPIVLTPVKAPEVKMYTSRKCKTCWGKGEVVVVVTRMQAPLKSHQKPRHIPTDDRAGRLCDCAMRRFRKENHARCIIDPKTGQLFWIGVRPEPAAVPPTPITTGE